jgi:hypothetical protein
MRPHHIGARPGLYIDRQAFAAQVRGIARAYCAVKQVQPAWGFHMDGRRPKTRLHQGNQFGAIIVAIDHGQTVQPHPID